MALLSLLLALAMIIHPQATFNGANNGLKTWALILIPSLLPFFIIADVMIELGVLKFFGVLLEPLMRPVFKQPGEAGFVMAMGFTSGFPMGAILTNSLYEKNLCTKEEASRLIAFTNNSSPLFLLVAIPVGMLHNPPLGILLIISHYLANIFLGVFLGFKKRKSTELFLGTSQSSLLKRSFQSFIKYNQEKPKPIGVLMGNAVKKSINNLLTIGGFVIFFAVLIEILHSTNAYNIISSGFSKFLMVLGFNPQLANGLTAGFFEMTLGAKFTSEISTSLIDKAMIISFILGWSGLSIQAQVTSIVSQNGIPIGNYLFGRLFQGIVAASITGFLYEPLINNLNLSTPAFSWYILENSTIGFWAYFSFTFVAGLIALFILFILLILSLLIYIGKKVFIR